MIRIAILDDEKADLEKEEHQIIGPSLVARHSTRPVRHKSWQNTSRIYNVLSNLR